MASEFKLSGMDIVSGFSLKSKQPIDARTTVDTQSNLNDLITSKVVYDGLITYVKDTKTLHIYKDGAWELMNVGEVIIPPQISYTAGTGLELKDTEFSNTGVLGISQDSTDGHKITVTKKDGSTTLTIPDSDTKVTSVDNHYAPSEDSTKTLSVDASGATSTATWNSTNLVTGVNIKRDGKGHVTGITVDSIKMPTKPETGNSIDGIQVGDVSNSLEFFDGDAKASYSIAIGTNDKTPITSIVGEIVSNLITVNNPTAKGLSSIAMGAGAEAISAGNNALGVLTTSGVKGYYWEDLETASGGGYKFKLATTRKNTNISTLGLAQAVISAVIPGLTLINKSTYADLNSAEFNWEVGDKLSFVNDNQFPACCTITGIDKSTGYITVDNLPFTGSNYKPKKISSYEFYMYGPDDKTVFASYQKTEAYKSITGTDIEISNKRWYPRNGVIELGWAATAIGAENFSSGAASFVSGFNNWQAGNFGATFGRDNIGGYCGVTSGISNENYGNHSIVVGRDLINNGTYNALSGRENTINNIPGADPSSHNNISGKGNVVSGHSNTVSGETNKAETTYQSSIFGGGHILNKANYVSIFGRGNGSKTPITGNYHFVTGTQNTVSGTMNTVFGGSYNYNGTDGNTVSGIGNIVGGSLNTASANFSLVHGASNISSHYYSYLLGRKLTSTNDYQFIIGTNNATAENAAFIIGSGAVNGTAKNALVVTKYGDITADGSINIKDSLSLTADSIVLGIDNNKSGYNNIILGSNNTANGECNIISGTENFVDYISTEFAGNTLLGYKNVTTGRYNVVNGTENENVSGSMSLINGSKNEVTGSKSLVNGSSNFVSGSNSITIGSRNEVTHNYGAAIGYRVTSTSNCSLVVGQLNQVGEAFKNDRLAIANGFESGPELRTLFTIPSNGYWHNSDFATGGAKERYYYANAMKPSDGLTYGFLLHELLGYETKAGNRRYAIQMENSTVDFNNPEDSTLTDKGVVDKYYLESKWLNGYSDAKKARKLYVDLPEASSNGYGVVKTGYSENNSGKDANRNYAVKLSNGKMYVNVPWEAGGSSINTSDVEDIVKNMLLAGTW